MALRTEAPGKPGLLIEEPEALVFFSPSCLLGARPLGPWHRNQPAESSCSKHTHLGNRVMVPKVDCPAQHGPFAPFSPQRIQTLASRTGRRPASQVAQQ